jgi:hypothetical protein
LAELLLVGYGPKVEAETALSGVGGIDHAFIAGSWAARYVGHNGEFRQDIDIVIVGSPNRDDVSESLVDAMRRIGQDAQVIFRSAASWRNARDAFIRTARTGRWSSSSWASHSE